MRQRESRQAVADARLGLVGELFPARADRHAAQLEAHEHRRGVLHVDVEVGHRRGERRGEVAEAPVVEVEHRVELSPGEVEHRAVPPQVVQEKALAAPVLLEAGEPGDALGRPALHLEHVRHGVRAPDLGRIELHRAAPETLRRALLARFFEGEREARHEPRIVAPLRGDALERGAHLGLPAAPEIVRVREAHREQVARPDHEDQLPLAQRAVHVAADPALERAHVRLLARRGGVGMPLRGAQRLGRGRHGGAAVGEHHEVAPQAVRRDESRIGLQRGLRVLRQIGVEARKGLERAVVGVGRGGDGGAERQVVAVFHASL